MTEDFFNKRIRDIASDDFTVSDIHRMINEIKRSMIIDEKRLISYIEDCEQYRNFKKRQSK